MADFFDKLNAGRNLSARHFLLSKHTHELGRCHLERGKGCKAPQESEDGGKVFIPAKPKVHFDDPAQIFRVCACCRVSTGSEEPLSSFELQQAHYRQPAKERPNRDLRHVYADEGISGTSLKNRAEFNAMIAACERGEYDLIVIKSVSRFARNPVDCISLIRKLKNLSPPVGVFFETDHLNTLGKDSEWMLTFLASIAQEESVKKREAMVWSLAQRFKDRKLLTPPPLGYDRQRDAAGNYIKYAPLVVNKAEAKVVRSIFDAYLHGWSQADIADFLTDIGCRHFGAALFGIMEWDPDLLYRVRGTWIRRSDGQVILFNLENAVSVLLAPAEDAGKKRIELLPEQWEHGFGEGFYGHIVENEIFYMAKSAAWQSHRPSVPAPGMAQYGGSTEEELQAMMETLTREAAAGHAGT